MITRYDGHGSFAKQYLKEGSIGGAMKVSPLHSHGELTYGSGENLSPRSVLEQRALSGLAIAIDLEEKMKLSHAQENGIWGRLLCKQSIWHLNTQEPKSIEGGRERLYHVNHDERERDGDERETLSGGSTGVGLKIVTSVHQMKGAHEGLTVSRSGARERINGGEREATSNVRSRVLARRGGERKEDKMLKLDMEVSSAGDMAMDSVKSRERDGAARSAGGRWQSTCWTDELRHMMQTCPPCARSAVQDSIFYCASDLHPTVSDLHEPAADDAESGDPARSSVEDFLKCCYLCKRRLHAGKDIYMYRGDQAFCSLECRYEQILKDERISASAA